MTPDELFRYADQKLGPALSAEGFSVGQNGEFVRESSEGLDRVLLDTDSRKAKFYVGLSFYPAEMEVLTDFLGGEDRGFPCGPYLTPAGVRRGKYRWSYQPQHLESSMKKVEELLQSVGLPWLRQLRNPEFFAAEVDPEALFDAGLAHERAGHHAKAGEIYLRLFDRFREMLSYAGDDLVMRESGKRFIFVAEKLGVEPERVRRFREYHQYWRPIPRLRDSSS